jgi:hypothetical protein
MTKLVWRYALVREAIQNSTDAPKAIGIVKVRFDVFEFGCRRNGQIAADHEGTPTASSLRVTWTKRPSMKDAHDWWW